MKRGIIWLGTVLVIGSLIAALMPFRTSAAYSCLTGGDHGGANWDPATDCPGGIAGVHTNIGTLTIASGETATVQTYSSSQYGSVTISAATINIVGTLSANGKGYPGGTGGGNGSGPGAGTGGGTQWGGGAGYGGAGGNGTNGAGGGTYGDSFGSESLGSGGGSSGSAAGGAGGGSIILIASGTTTVSGSITANGSTGGGAGAGGGSGGSIHISTGSLAGAGTLAANGGNGTSGAGNSGSGGGGRIAIHYSNATSFSGSTTAAAGTTGALGGAGTVTNAHDASSFSCLTGGDHGGADWDPSGACSGLNIAGNHTGIGAFSVPSGKTATVQAYDGTNFGSVQITAASASVVGTLSAIGKGYAGGPSSGTTQGSGPGGGIGGGGYGGQGGVGNGAGGTTYGSLTNPTDMGSGGGGVSGYVGGAGGGAIQLTTTGTTTVTGVIDVSGADAGAGCGESAGAGGSILVSANLLAGNGTINSNGGKSATGCGGGGVGGGGRIALKSAAAHTFNGSVSVAIGPSGWFGGGVTGATSGTAFILDTATNDLTIPAANGAWLGSDGPFSYHNVAINGNVTLAPTNATLLDFVVSGNLTLAPGVTVTAGGSYTTNSNGVGVYLDVTGNVTVPATSTITATGQGYAGGVAPGSGTSQGFGPGGGIGGGGYGGQGGVGNGAGGTIYGSLTAPVDLGSGGGGVSTYTGGAGGGAIRISGATVTIDGTVSSNGADAGAGCGESAGSGGSVYISATLLAGAGSVTTNGGKSATGCGGGGVGGGGRIALYSTNTHTFNGIITTSLGPSGWFGGGVTGAENGTAFILDTTADNLTVPTANGRWLGDASSFSYHNVTINADVTFQPVSAGLLTITTSGSFTVTNSATVTMGGSYTTGSNGVGVFLNAAGSVTIDAGASIIATGQGYAGGTSAPTSGSGPGGGGTGSGGGYGGKGGGSAGGSTYGSSTAPVDLGSGGGGVSGYAGAAGGGAIKITTPGTLTIAGTLSANGAAGGAGCGEGGGSGGSLYLTLGTLAGAGTLTAKGGEGATGCAGSAGGGGRIAIYYSIANTWSGTTLTAASAATAGLNHAGTAPVDGTVVINPTGNPTVASLIQRKADCTTALGSGATVTGAQAVCLGATASDSLNPDTLTLQVEIKPNGTAFANSATVSASSAYTGVPLNLSVTYTTLSAGTAYHWQARVVDAEGYATAWTPLGGSPDFVMPGSTPTRVGSVVIDTDTDYGAGSLSGAQLNGTGTAATVSLPASLSGPAGDIYERPVTVDNTANASALTNYQVQINFDTASLISLGKMNSDCSDLRVADSDQTTQLSYWIESGCNTSATKIWVLVPSIAASSSKTIYLFYGNAGAGAASSIKTTFQNHADDFAGTTLDSSIWATANTDANRTVTINNGATIACTTAQNCDWWASTYLSPNMQAALPSGDWEARVKLSSLTDITNYHAGPFLMQDSQNVYMFGRMHASSVNGQDIDKLVANTGTGQLFTNTVTSTPVYFAIRKSGTTYTFLYSIDNVNWTVDYTTSSLGFTPTKIVLPGKKWTTSQAYSVTYNNFYIRSYTAAEPAVSVGAESGGYTTPGTWTSGTGASALLLNQNSAWGDGSADSIAFRATLGGVSRNASVTFALRTAASASGLASASYTTIGTADGGSAFVLRKSDLDGLGVSPLAYAQVRATLAVSNNVPTPSLDSMTLYFVPNVPSLHVSVDTDSDFSLGSSSNLNVTGSGTAASLSIAQPPGPSQTTYRRTITIDNTGNAATLTNYQVPVTLDTASLISAGKLRADCGDIRINDSDNTTAITNYWVDGCNSASTKIWVKVPSIAASSSKTIYLYYGNPALSSQSSTSNTFTDDLGSTSAAWAFDEASGSSAADASGNGTTLTASGTTVAAGKFGNARSFSTTSDYLHGTPNSSIDIPANGSFSAFAWIKTSTDGKMILQYQNGNPLIYMEVGATTAGGTAHKLVVYLRDNSNVADLPISGATTIDNGAWHLVGFTASVSGSSRTVTLYVDGHSDGTSTWGSAGALTGTGGALNVGGQAVNSFNFNGLIDDMRIYHQALSAAAVSELYASAAYSSTNDAGHTLIRTYSSPEPAATTGSETALSASGTWQSGSGASALQLSAIKAWGDGLNGASVAVFLSGTGLAPGQTIDLQLRTAASSAGLATAPYMDLGTVSEGISLIKTKADLDALGISPLGFAQLQATLTSTTGTSPVFDRVIVYFAQGHTLTYTAGANGTISGATPQTVVDGQDGSPVTAVPDTGYYFVDWSDSSTANPRTDTNVTNDISVTASFAINTYTLAYTAGAHGSISGSTPQTVDYGSAGTAVTAVPDTGYAFDRWSDGITANPRTDVGVTHNVTVTAQFVSNTYTLTYSAGAHGSISGDALQTVAYGDSGTAVTAVPDSGYTFDQWSDGVTANPRLDLDVTHSIAVTASFVPVVTSYTLTYAAGPHGHIKGQTLQTVNAGEDGTAVRAVADHDYRFAGWSDGSSANPRRDRNVQHDISVTAIFASKNGPINLDNYTPYISGLGQDVSLTPGQSVVFSAGGQQHTATVDQLGTDYAVLVISADQPITERLILTQAATVDVTGDHRPDISIRLKNVTATYADITFEQLQQAVQAAGKPTAGSPLLRAVAALPSPLKYILPYFLFILLAGDLLLLILLTQREIAEARRLQRSIEREHQISELKATFTMLVSHYLRTPLSVVRGGVDLLPAAAKADLQADAATLSATIEEIIQKSVGRVRPAAAAPEPADSIRIPWLQPIVFFPAVLVGGGAFIFDYLAQHAGSFTIGQINLLVQAAVYASTTIALYAVARQLIIHRRETAAKRRLLAEEQNLDKGRDRVISEASASLSRQLQAVRSHAAALGDIPAAKFLRTGTEQLQTIVDKLVIAEQLKGSTAGGALTSIKLRDICAAASRPLQSKLQAKGVQLAVDPDAAFETQSPSLVTLVLKSLLDNAADYSPAGGTIRVHATQAGRTFVLRVSDAGPGIPKDKQFALFQPFARTEGAEGTTVFNREGMGFSLYLDKIILFYLHGNIMVEPVTPHGTCVALTLPTRV